MARRLPRSPSRALRRLLGEDEGAGLVEYVVLGGVIAMVALAGARAFGGAVDAKVRCQAARIAGLQGSCSGGSGVLWNDTGLGAPGAPAPLAAAEPPLDEIGTADGASYESFDGPLFVTGQGDGVAASPTDIDQGQLGDCYLLAAIGAIAARSPSAIEEMIEPNGDGGYTVTLQTDPPAWQVWASDTTEVNLTSQFPAEAGDPVFAGTGDASTSGGETWVMALEKAYALAHGGYAGIGGGGNPGDALEWLTGNDAGFYRQGNAEQLVVAWREGRAITVITLSQAGQTNPLYNGDNGKEPLIMHHAYYVTAVDEASGTITLHNPWSWGAGETVLTYDEFNAGISSFQTVEVDGDD